MQWVLFSIRSGKLMAKILHSINYGFNLLMNTCWVMNIVGTCLGKNSSPYISGSHGALTCRVVLLSEGWPWIVFHKREDKWSSSVNSLQPYKYECEWIECECVCWSLSYCFVKTYFSFIVDFFLNVQVFEMESDVFISGIFIFFPHKFLATVKTIRIKIWASKATGRV